MRPHSTFSRWTVAVLLLPLGFIAVSASLILSVRRQQDQVSRRVLTITAMSRIEDGLHGLRGEVALDDAAARADLLRAWARFEATYPGEMTAAGQNAAGVPDVEPRLAQIQVALDALRPLGAAVSSDALSREVERDALAQLRRQAHNTSTRVRDTIKTIRGQLAIASLDLQSKWRYLGALAVGACLLAVLAAILSMLHQKRLRQLRLAQATLKENEELFRAISTQMPDSLFLLDIDDPTCPAKIIHANEAACSSHLYSFDELDGRSIAFLDDHDTARQIPARLNRVAAGETVVFEGARRRKDGSVFPIEVTSRMITFAGRPVILAIDRDITERIRAADTDRHARGELEARVRERTAELTAANESLQHEMSRRRHSEDQARRHRDELAHVLRVSTAGEMAAGVAHQLNQPLAAIVNYIRACTRRLQSDQWQAAALIETLDKAALQAQRAAEIVRRVNDFLRKRSPQRSLTDVNGVVTDVAALADAEARACHVDIRLELAPGLPAIMADAIQIEQVLLNLVRNALEALDDGASPRREVWIRTDRAADDGVEIAVGDTGPGIPSEIAPCFFDPFITSKPDGMGLGLSISRSIVEAHRGRLSAAANAERGMTFTVILPVGTGAANDGR